MEVLIDCYFDRLFSGMERSCLASRHKRRELVNYFTDVINSCAEAEKLDKRDICERIVLSALRYHNITMMENGSVCLLGKFHNVLYVAAKLCYDWDLGNSEIVGRLLDDIFYCEGTFERLLVGAIFGTRVTHFLSGWKCDFDDRQQNIRALVYFLDHATSRRLEYRCDSSPVKRRFIDVPMESYGQVLPLRVAVQHGTPDILLVMLRYGASVESDRPSPIEIILTKLDQLESAHASDVVYPEHLLTCLRLLLRTVVTVCVRTPDHLAIRSGIVSVPLYESEYSAIPLLNRGLVPPERSGLRPAELRHLCRCRIREILRANWALPHGIKSLQIPDCLRDYLDLLRD